MLQKLYEQIDSKVLTADVRESLEREFAAAVDSKASAIADSRIEEIEAELHEQQQQKLRELDESAAAYEAELQAQYNERSAEFDDSLNEHKLMLNQKAQEYIDERLDETNRMIDLYASRVADELVNIVKEPLSEHCTVLKANAMYNAMATAASLAGHDIGLAINESAKNAVVDYNNRISQLIEENRALKSQVKSLNNHLIFEKTTEGLSMYQKERMRLGVAGLIESADAEDLKANLMNIKESYNSDAELDFSETKKSHEISDLLFKNI